MEAAEYITPADEKEKRKEATISMLNDAQREAAINYKGFSLVSAGPGSGRLL